MASFKSVTVAFCAAFVGSHGCTTEITSVDDLVAQLQTFDVKLDVRTWNEYIGNEDADCNSGSDPLKCNYGHHSAFHFLNNPNNTQRASVWRDSNANYVMEQSLADALGSCYGSDAATTKVVISCHSGGRSEYVQQQLLDAGFVCANLYNFAPGARGLYQAWEAAGSAPDSPLAMHTNTNGDNPGSFDWTSCPAGDPLAAAGDDNDEATRVGTIIVLPLLLTLGLASLSV